MFVRALENITKSDIMQLIDSQVRESRTCDYKETLPGNKDDDKKELLADVSSFANAGGGRIYYGISDKRDGEGKSTGCPEAALGLANVNLDKEKQRIEQMIATGIAPRILGFQIHAVEGFSQGPVLILDIPQSWTGPHMITYQRWSRFYSRNSAGKYPLDVQDIRAAFAASESVPDRVRRFRDARLARILAGETPVPLRAPHWLAFHIVPVASSEKTDVDIHRIYQNPMQLRPIDATGYSMRYNMDGVCVWTGSVDSKGTPSYSQIFHSGAIESVYTDAIVIGSEERYVYARLIEDTLIEATTDYLRTLSSLGVGPPFVLMASLIGIKGTILERFASRDSFRFLDLERYRIERDILILPDIWIEDPSIDKSHALRPMFDALWQAAGMPGSENYESDGTRKPKR